MLNNQSLYNALKSLQVIPEKDLHLSYEEAEKTNQDLHQILLNHDLISDDNLGKVKADLYNLPYINLTSQVIDKKVASLIPESFARTYNCIAYNSQSNINKVALINPDNQDLISRLKTRFGNTLELAYTTPKQLDKALHIYSNDPQSSFDQLLHGTVERAKSEQSEPPIIKIVDLIIDFASERGASDIHLEPTDDNSKLRFRIDGVMYDIANFPLSLHTRLVTRLKVMAGLKTDETKIAQDGKIAVDKNGDQLDIRLSLVPIINGESIVMRVLSSQSRSFSLLDLGLSSSDSLKLNNAKSKPHGMILATGPTGSGKTTTLYALLKLLNNSQVSIMTIEDPVEYEIDGISQIQVNKATNLTFADGLKSIVRQDPDIILVGEIRDSETAGIAINSAMTGHLVLSTLHTNDAATTIPRLIDMEIEPFLISSTINLIIAQRLVRKICTKCRESIEVEINSLQSLLSADIIQKSFKDSSTRLYHGKGCPSCQNTGYGGRIGIFEIMTLSDSLKEAIIAKKDANYIKNLAIQEGMITMLEDGLTKVKAGETTIEEVLRVTKE